MKSYYDRDVDALLIKLSESKPEYGEDIGKGIIVHFSEKRVPVEIEILGAKRYLVDWLEQALETSPQSALVH